jgi:hypothetical protein
MVDKHTCICTENLLLISGKGKLESFFEMFGGWMKISNAWVPGTFRSPQVIH